MALLGISSLLPLVKAHSTEPPPATAPQPESASSKILKHQMTAYNNYRLSSYYVDFSNKWLRGMNDAILLSKERAVAHHLVYILRLADMCTHLPPQEDPLLAATQQDPKVHLQTQRYIKATQAHLQTIEQNAEKALKRVVSEQALSEKKLAETKEFLATLKAKDSFNSNHAYGISMLCSFALDGVKSLHYGLKETTINTYAPEESKPIATRGLFDARILVDLAEGLPDALEQIIQASEGNVRLKLIKFRKQQTEFQVKLIQKNYADMIDIAKQLGLTDTDIQAIETRARENPFASSEQFYTTEVDINKRAAQEQHQKAKKKAGK